jgi:hypothetical protein
MESKGMWLVRSLLPAISLSPVLAQVATLPEFSAALVVAIENPQTLQVASRLLTRQRVMPAG